MLQKLKRKMDELHMVSSGDLLLAGVSGGADSVCLLLLLKELQKSYDFQLEAVHVEHGIRGEESRQDAAFVNHLCQKHGILCHTVSVDVPAFSAEMGMGLEEAARKLRYDVFSKMGKERNAKIVLAHHMEDNAETILFQMARGSSLTGICGMQPIRKDEYGVIYIRPLLWMHREEIEEYLNKIGQKYCIDSTNKDIDYSRNYLRNVILPEMEKINLQAVSHINRVASQLSDVKEYIEAETRKHWTELVKVSDSGVKIEIDKLSMLHNVMQKEIIYKAICEVAGAKKDISEVHVAEVLELCKNQSGKKVDLPYGILAQKEHALLHILKKKDDDKEEKKVVVSSEMLETCRKSKTMMILPLTENGERLEIKIFCKTGEDIKFSQNPYTKWMNYDKIKQGFCIRTRQSGDYFISDIYHHHKKLKQYFIDEKIPISQRDEMLLLAQQDLVLWLIGGRISEHLKVTEDTKTIIEIKYKGEDENECRKRTKY